MKLPGSSAILKYPPLMTEADRIRELLAQKPGLKTLQIAAELGLERSQAATALKSLEARLLRKKFPDAIRFGHK